MKIQQLSVFLENRSGRLANITNTLGDVNVNIRAMSLADSSDFGILRLIVDNTEKAVDILKKSGFTVSLTDVVAVGISDVPGGLGRFLTLIETAGVNIEYMYAFIEKNSDQAVMIFRFNDTVRAIEKMASEGIHMLNYSEIISM